MISAADVAAALDGKQIGGGGWSCRCPNTGAHKHGDKNRSFTVTEKDQKLLVNCKAGCSQEEVVEALRNQGLWNGKAGASLYRPPMAAVPAVVYDYIDAKGKKIAEKGRFESSGRKTFSWRLAGADAWTGLGGKPMSAMPLYRSDILSAMPPSGIPVYWVEGEKCVETLLALGELATTTGGGAGQRDFGKGLELLRDHHVILWPDNDDEGRRYMRNVALALEGVASRIELVAPDLPEKADVVDYLAAGLKLEDLIRENALPEPTVADQGDGWIVRVPAPTGTAVFDFQAFRLFRGELQTDCEVWLEDAPGTPKDHHWARLVLASTSGRQNFARELKENLGDQQWLRLLSQAVGIVRTAYVEDDAAEYIDMVDPTADRYLVAPLSLENRPSVLFGDGGTGKSFLALRVAVCAMFRIGWGETFKAPDRRAKVMYVDYEADAGTMRRRLERVLAGADLDLPAGQFLYWHTKGRPFSELAEALRRRVIKDNIDLVIVDSAAGACGGSASDDDLATAFFNALATLECGSLIVAHIPKDQKDTTKPFGSTVWSNRARTTWYCLAETESEDTWLDVGLVHRKINDGKLHREPLGLRIHFQDPEGPIQFFTQEAAGWLDTHRPLPARILDRLEDHFGGMSVPELAESLNMGEPTVRTTLHRMAKRDDVTKSAEGNWRKLTKAS